MSFQLNTTFALQSLLAATCFFISAIAIANPHLSSHLQQLQHDYARHQGAESFTSSDKTLSMVNSHHIMLTITSTVAEAPQTMQKLQNLGMTHMSHYKHLIAGVLPITQMTQLESMAGVHWVSSHKATANSRGLAHNAGNAALFTDVVKKQHGVYGSGITIGVLSDSYDCLGTAEADISSGDLPADVQVVKEYSFCELDPSVNDEGRAMMQLIHDIAPGAKLLFYTAWESPVDFAQGIVTLADKGANIIVDDISWLLMPMVQEGPIAQAVNEVEQRGVVYFSAAGNNARLSYQQAFRKTLSANGSLAHDFGLAAGMPSDVYQKITVPKGVSVRIVLQWDDPARIAGGIGASSDLDLFVFNSDNKRMITSSQDNNVGQDPVEIVSIEASEDELTEYNLFIRKGAGDDPFYLKYVMFSTGLPELDNVTEPDVELLHINIDGKLVTAEGSPIQAGIAVVIAAGYTGEFSVSPGLLQIGKGGAPIISNSINGQHEISLDNNLYPIDRPIWFIPQGYRAQLDENNKIVLLGESDVKEAQTDVRIEEYATRSSTIYGHPNAAGAIAVGAMSYQDSPWFNGDSTIEAFSSAGGLPIVFDTAGNPLQTLDFRPKPEIIAVDDIDTTFFPAVVEQLDTDQNGFPNFKGTSAAAPNAAAVAALLLEKYSYLQPKQVKQIMMQGTIDLVDPALVPGEYSLPYNPCASGVEFDWGTGCGLIQADLIFDVASNFSIAAGLGDFNQDGCVDAGDTAILFGALRSNSEVQKKYDLTGDGIITGHDFDALQDLYGHGCSG